MVPLCYYKTINSTFPVADGNVYLHFHLTNFQSVTDCSAVPSGSGRGESTEKVRSSRNEPTFRKFRLN